MTECQVDVGTQTEPVVVLSLAQAAVLGLISQNEIFGATIAPNGFYTGELRECPPPPPEAMEYEYADQLIGANGDYLADPAGDPEPQPHCSERRRPGPRGRTKRPRSTEEPEGHPHKESSPQAQVKGEHADTDVPPSCIHTQSRHSSGKSEDPLTRHRSMKDEQACRNCTSCVRDTPRQQAATGARPEQDRDEANGRNRERKEDLVVAEEEEEQALNLKTTGETGSPLENRYYEPNEVAYDSAEMPMPGEYEDNSQAMLWSDPEGLARRMQIDRLDINVQIDESYCVDVGEGLKRWKCRMCEKSYTSKYNLVTHILGHNGIKPHECLHCGKLFKQPSHLQTHLLTHQGTRPHKCTVCEKAFTQTSHLKRHMLQHSDVKPYSCRFCGRGFAYPSELRTHESKHENGQCHVCTQCGLEFPTYAHLKRHLASHQGPTTYQCTECHKSFAYRSQLQNHLMKHQNVRPYVCPECGMEFVQIHHLRQHALTHKVPKTKTMKLLEMGLLSGGSLKQNPQRPWLASKQNEIFSLNRNFLHLSGIHLEGVLPIFTHCAGINPHRKKYMADLKRSLFSKTSYFVNTVFKGRECFVWLARPPALPTSACVLCCVSSADPLPFEPHESLVFHFYYRDNSKTIYFR